MVRLAPKDTEKLAGGIHSKIKLSAKNDEGTVDIGPARKTFWSLFMEFGTRLVAAIPFIRPALDIQKGAALSAMKSRLEEMLDKIRAKGR